MGDQFKERISSGLVTILLVYMEAPWTQLGHDNVKVLLALVFEVISGTRSASSADSLESWRML